MNTGTIKFKAFLYAFLGPAMVISILAFRYDQGMGWSYWGIGIKIALILSVISCLCLFMFLGIVQSNEDEEDDDSKEFMKSLPEINKTIWSKILVYHIIILLLSLTDFMHTPPEKVVSEKTKTNNILNDLKTKVIGTYNINTATNSFKFTLTLKANGDGYAKSSEGGFEEVETFSYNIAKRRYKINDGNYFYINLSDLSSYTSQIAYIINKMWVIHESSDGSLELRLMKKNETLANELYFIKE